MGGGAFWPSTFLGSWPLPPSSKPANLPHDAISLVLNLPLFSSSFKDPCDYAGPIQKTQGNLIT